MHWAFSQDVESSTSKFILVCLAYHLNPDGDAYPSVETIARETGLDRKTVISGISKLLNLGLIDDLGDRKGATKQVRVFKLKGPKNGTVPKTDRKGPVFPGKGPVFPMKGSQKRDTEVQGKGMNHKGNGDAPDFKSTVLRQLEEARKQKNQLFAAYALEHSIEGTSWRSNEARAKWEMWGRVERDCLERLPNAI